MLSLDELLYGPNGTKVKKEEVFGTPLKDLVGKKKVKAKWVNGKLIDESGNVIQEAIPMKNALMGINDFMPVTGDIQAGVMAANDLKQGNYGNAALNSIGLLPFVPALGGVVKNKALEKKALGLFGITSNPKETGYILDSGARLDLSGRHEASGYKKLGDRYFPEKGQPDYLKGDRVVDHRSVFELQENGQYGWDSLSNFMDQSGAVRYMPETGVSMVDTNMPSEAQVRKFVDDFKKTGDPLIIDIDRAKNGENLASMEFENPNFEEVYNWIKKQYKAK